MNTRTDQKHTVEELSHRWREGHRDLDEFFDEYRQWAYEIAQRGFPHFGETACRLKQLRETLSEHFAQEDEICDRLSNVVSTPSPELDANRRQVAADHVNLLARLDELISRLSEADPPFESWQQAVEEVELFWDALELHEEQESDCITWLAPKKG